MNTRQEFEERQKWTANQIREAGYPLTDEEATRIEVADFGLGEIDHFGIQLITYVNTERVCSKDIVMKPWQICPEHLHPNEGGELGKEETFRCRKGLVYLYVQGSPTQSPSHRLRSEDERRVSVFHEIILNPGDQYTIMPNNLHWFQAGNEGCIVTEFSTRSTDGSDVFTDKAIVRAPKIPTS
ncbi:MAG: D-lyxose/D-mannose family sugar isomerase [Actinomycetes bacterium]